MGELHSRRSDLRVLVFCMPQSTHFARLRPLLSSLLRVGVVPAVWTHTAFREEVLALGAEFVDLFARYPLEDVDRPDTPNRLRYVTHAGHHAKRLVEELRAVPPSLVVYDSFAVIGYVVGRALGVPYVHVCAGHGVHAAAFLEPMKASLGSRVSAECLQAVRILREEFGIHDASPFMVADVASPHLNVYGEPPAFLSTETRRALEPVMCLGSIAPEDWSEAVDLRTPARPPDGTLRVYASFGTRAWRPFREQALAAMQAISTALGSLEHARGILSLGGHSPSQEELRSLTRENVTVETTVAQKRVLLDSDVFITHHGLNSTHEAVFAKVPMISHPFHWDQPGQAETCQRLGIAVPSTDGPRRRPPTPEQVLAAIERVERSRAAMMEALDRLNHEEHAVIRRRPRVAARLVALATGQIDASEHSPGDSS